MLWLKRNLFLLIGILVAVGLMALAAVYLASRLNADRRTTADLARETQELSNLVRMNPTPNDQNVQIARNEVKKLQQFVSDVKPILHYMPPPPLDDAGFRSLLDMTIVRLQQEAANAGVNLPLRYNFSFTAQAQLLSFPSNSLDRLTVQLEEVRALSEILFRNKIHTLVELRRVRAYADEQAGSDYIDNKLIVTNRTLNATIAPYEVTFQSFSAELAAVLDELQRSPIYFVVKKMNVRPLQVRDSAPPPPEEPTRKPTAKSKPGTPPPPPPPPKMETILDENPLRITLWLEVVRQIQPAK
jgi:hypothetical protein